MYFCSMHRKICTYIRVHESINVCTNEVSENLSVNSPCKG